MNAITKKQLDEITSWLKWNIFRNSKLMWAEYPDIDYDLIDIIASLHNLLYQAITGERYDYMFHWANKVGSDCSDDFFDELLEDCQL